MSLLVQYLFVTAELNKQEFALPEKKICHSKKKTSRKRHESLAYIGTRGGSSAGTIVGTLTKSKLTLNGLVSGAKPWFRAPAIGLLGESGWSDGGQGKVS
ncbi:MAG: hypothetical protein ABI378_08250 [Chitinophagaceae bacterium]